MSAPHCFSNSNSVLVNNMSIKQATYRERKTVLVSVYVEKPRRRAPAKHHTIIKQELGGGGKGYNRRAQLLHYSRSLRESARSPPFKALPSKSVPSTDQQKLSNKDIVGVQRKATYSRTPGCFGKWRIAVPSFMRCLAKKDVSKTRNNRIKAVMKSLQLQLQKKWSFFSKPIPLLHKNQHPQF